LPTEKVGLKMTKSCFADQEKFSNTKGQSQ